MQGQAGAPLALVDYSTQQVLVEALTRAAAGQGAAFADRILPLMAEGEAGTRSAVLKILLGTPDRRAVVRRYIVFSKTLAGWARDRALERMRAFGNDLLEPTIELLSDPDQEVRASAMLVAQSFEDLRTGKEARVTHGSRAQYPCNHWIKPARADVPLSKRRGGPAPPAGRVRFGGSTRCGIIEGERRGSGTFRTTALSRTRAPGISRVLMGTRPANVTEDDLERQIHRGSGPMAAPRSSGDHDNGGQQ